MTLLDDRPPTDLGLPGMGDDDQPEKWQDRALCAQTDPEAFFPEKGGSTADAKRMCARCPVIADCREYALATDQRFGVWGGLSERERRRLRRPGGIVDRFLQAEDGAR